MGNQITGVEMIAKERDEQLNKHHYDESHDSYNDSGQLRRAAMFAITCDEYYYPDGWEDKFKRKILTKGNKERLAIAGALIAAELDRLNAENPNS